MDANLAWMIGIAIGAGGTVLVMTAENALRRGQAKCSALAEEALAIIQDIEPEGKSEALAFYRAQEALGNLKDVLVAGELQPQMNADERGSICVDQRPSAVEKEIVA